MFQVSRLVGQVVCVLKELASPEMAQGRCHLTTHVSIPTAHQSGMTIYMRKDNPNIEELLEAPPLPLLDDS